MRASWGWTWWIAPVGLGTVQSTNLLEIQFSVAVFRHLFAAASERWLTAGIHECHSGLPTLHIDVDAGLPRINLVPQQMLALVQYILMPAIFELPGVASARVRPRSFMYFMTSVTHST